MPSNPLLDFSDLPLFAQIKPEHITPAIDELLAAARQTIKTVTGDTAAAAWSTVVEPLVDATEKIGRAWGAVDHINAVVNTPELRKEYNANLPKISVFFSELGQNLELYAKYKALAARPDYAAWPLARRTTVQNALRDFRLSGAELSVDQKQRFAAIEQRLSELGAKFSENVLDATDAFSLFIESKAELAGIPEDALIMYSEAAKKDGKTGYKITLQFPSYFPLMQYADQRALREQIYAANVKRAAEFEPQQFDNAPIIRERLQLTREKASLLGFKDYASLSVETKMAESAAQVLAFERDLAARSKPFAVKEFAELADFARQNLAIPQLEAWDTTYVGEKMRQALYDFSDQEVKQYFPEPKAVAGLFNVVKTLYGVDVVPGQAPVWHPDVRYFDLVKDGLVFAGFYFDLYAREGKRAGAWMNDARGRRRLADGSIQKPIAYLTTNFSAPVGGKPALFTHDQVTTLFHEFGHGLQHMLTRIDELPVSGIGGVEWDAVELPSQIMENFCWEWDMVQQMSAHVDTGAPLPKTLFDKMYAAKNFLTAMQMVRQLEFGIFDMLVYSDFDADQGDWLKLLDTVRREVAVIRHPAYNRFPNSFSHIFAGGYAAGYYSYKWAEVLSADAYSAFEEAGGANPVTGRKFWDEVLAMGGSRPAAESFKAFRGRDPSIDALLRHNGLVAGTRA
ncbi:MAG: oligopeptidase A [Spirochaetes bacterium GWD1_61_31]|nr:MAG: oligopeptidase A [Spirochaetes bacterium GWB1_60_80]OHD35125.1 MAG: oligopeptidase A [Spirochaetes bacterium GWC1_61_12]OHD43644.1 MAG: oligopeptidase A [Spirochaetes bacterium GWD1_61_31]OHD44135.1 MAG: oligopeptidase A [Spirochaetes bacterium GWE1_60_18]OHD61823.1 MAG: oligopeptidase A [Spirochaetes bacterium GWF1_60_12]HAW85113.1 oligopeptidase A [Spirochaetaceae bacterium]